MTDDRKATPGSKQDAEEPAEVRKPPIIAGSGRGGLSGGADPGSTGSGIAGSDVDMTLFLPKVPLYCPRRSGAVHGFPAR